MSERLVASGTLKGHNGWVTSIATPADPSADFIVSGSRDKSVMIWKITNDGFSVGYAQKSLHGHNHFVQDVVLSKDGKHALSGSWDGMLRLWKLDSGKTIKKFVGHKGDVMSVSFSPDNRQIVSASRDKTIKIWNILGECKITLDAKEKCHNEWISCVKYSPSTEKPTIVSAGWDKLVKVWDLSKQTVEFDLKGHTGYVNTVGISPDGSICATAGKDGNISLWDLKDGKLLFSLPAGGIVNALAFSPNRFWLCAAVGGAVKVFDLQTSTVVDEHLPEAALEGENGQKNGLVPECLSLAWSADGNTLYSGHSDSNIRAWKVVPTQFGN